MRSMKLLALALIAILAAGPVLAQDAMTPAADTSTAAPAKATKHKHKGTKKHTHKKAAAPATTEAPAAQ